MTSTITLLAATLAACGGEVTGTSGTTPSEDPTPVEGPGMDQVGTVSPPSVGATVDTKRAPSTPPTPPSVLLGGPGMTNCGPGGRGTESCATSQVVPAGSFVREYGGPASGPAQAPTSISSLYIDRYEITVGRFRQFVAAEVAGWLPSQGSGKHSYLNSGNGLLNTGGEDMAAYEPGWQVTWNENLATDAASWDQNLACDGSEANWTASPGANENRPINCISWYEAYAFCIWDGGFLPSDAELNFTESGGGQQRVYPWSSPPSSEDIDCSYANYGGGSYGAAGFCSAGGTNDVGSESPKGDGLFGQSDLGGNVWEWVLDTDSDGGGCTDCADFAPTPTPPGLPASYTNIRGNRGGGLGAGFSLQVATADDQPAASRSTEQGARCGRAP